MAENKKYFFKGRNTAVIAPDKKTAIERKKRPATNELAVPPQPLTNSEKKQAANGEWITTRSDGKSKAKSSVGKGRGEGPPRKSGGKK